MNENYSRLGFAARIRRIAVLGVNSEKVAMICEGAVPKDVSYAAPAMAASGMAGVACAMAALTPARTLSLTELPCGVDGVVAEILTPTLAEDRELVLRLIEIGFVPGERVRILAQGFPGREPLAVRLGNTVFALRRFEASYVRVSLDAKTSPATAR
jgi:ferrous iron transport protein A